MQRLGLRFATRAAAGSVIAQGCTTTHNAASVSGLALSSTANALFAAMRGGATSAGDPSAAKVTHYSKLGMDGFTDVTYNTAADEFLENIESVVDGLEHPEVEDISCNGGVLTLETASHGTYILNKQAPNVQLWLSSPISGPHHYDMVVEKAASGQEETHWLSDHDGHNLKEKMEEELSGILKTQVKL